jgi:hypothetical protein
MSATVMIFDWLRPAVLVWLASAAWFVGLETVLLGSNVRAEMAADRQPPPWHLSHIVAAQGPRELASQGRDRNPLPECRMRVVTAADRFLLASDNQPASPRCPPRPNR